LHVNEHHPARREPHAPLSHSALRAAREFGAAREYKSVESSGNRRKSL
jgi:DNA-binding transcriptional regulator of glucitol operon